MKLSKVWVAGVVPVVVAVLAVLPWAVAWGELPDPVASHFAVGGEADDSAPRAVLAASLGGIGLAVAVLLALAARRPTPALPMQAGLLAFVGTLLGVVGLSTVWVNHGLDDWREATLPLVWAAVAVGAALAAGAATAAAGSALAPPPPPTGRPTPPAVRAPGERLAWFGTARSPGFLAGTAALAVAGGVALVAGATATGLVVLATAVPMALFGSVHVVVGAEGVRVRSALPWPWVRIPLGEIEQASAPEVGAMERGGWGYRGSLRLFRRAAWMIRSGPALELQLTGNRRFTVAVDDAEQGAAVVNALVARPDRVREGPSRAPRAPRRDLGAHATRLRSRPR